jgi:hypothetical protein
MEQDGRTVWRVAIPALDPAWIDTADTLRAPRPRNEPLDEWRRKAPLRPVVFEDDGRLDGDAVHLHLEHRLAQRLLGRFRSQGLVHYDLARACIGQTKDSRPRVILLGRLALYGPRAGRLHDEIISVAARWTPTAARNAPLTPYAEGGSAERDTLTLLDKTLPESDATPVPVEVERRLNDTLRRDVDELRPHLEARAEAAAMTAVELLKARGVREAGELQQLIRERATRIRTATRTRTALQR